MEATILQDIVNGLSAGLCYALVAIGFTLIFGVLNAVNFAHGEIYMLGAFAGLFIALAIAPPFAALLLMVAAVGAFLGIGLERVAFRPLRRGRDEASLKSRALRESTLLSSLAVGIIVRELTEIAFGSDMQPIPDRLMINDPIPWGPVVFARGDFIIFAIAVILLAALQFLLRRTRVGLGIRAVSDDLLGALYAGVHADRVILWTFAIGSAIGAVAGLLVGLYFGTIMPYMGFTPTLKAFVAMLMGGMTSIPGAVICALLIGVCESLTTELVSSRWADLVPYTLLLLTLLVFPRGLFGRSVDRA
ncbi:MAG: branched-chain amino acid ABC transporter permease [Acetobacteraceae bacterium]|nr:branched-chain amino acid ABC transporter permease [Acetobacteraceae bacterium]